MMRYALVMIVAFAAFLFAGCAKNPDVCEGRISDFIGLQSAAEWVTSEAAPIPQWTKKGLQYVLEFEKRQTKFERCLEDKCGAKDSCGKEDKKCLETYETCISDQTSLSRGDWWKTEPIAALDPVFGLDWLPYLAVLFLFLWLNLVFPNSKWGRKSWEKTRWHKKPWVYLWLMVVIWVIYHILNAIFSWYQVTTSAFIVCLGGFASLYLQKLNNETEIYLRHHEVEPGAGSESETDSHPSLARFFAQASAQPPVPRERHCTRCNTRVDHAFPNCEDCGGAVADGPPAPVARVCPRCHARAEHEYPNCEECGAKID